MGTPPDDRALVALAQQGDRAALDRLLRLHYDRIHAVCRRIVGNDSDAADAAQEAMIAIVRGIRRFDGRAAFGTWAYRIATNAGLDELRRRKRRPVLAPPARDGLPHEIADHDAAVRITAIDERSLIEAALGDLPEEFRLPVVLRDVADLEYADIAQLLDIPIGTVKSRIARGRAALAVALEAGPATGAGNRTHGSERRTDEPPRTTTP